MPDTNVPLESPNVQTLRVQVDAVGAGADGSFVIGEAQFQGTVTRVSYEPSAAITGANTNSRTVQVTNRGQAGAGTTVVASLALVSGVNATADKSNAVTLSATPANLVVAQGDVLSFESLHVGTGIADPGGLAIIEITRG